MTTPTIREDFEVSRGRIIRQLENGHAEMNRVGLGSPALDEFNAEVIRQVAEADDPASALDAIVQLMREHRTGASCV